MVDTKHRTVQWQLDCYPFTRSYDLHGRIKKGLGCSLCEPADEREMVCYRETPSYQYSRIKRRCFSCNASFFEEQTFSNCVPQRGQLVCCCVHQSQGRNTLAPTTSTVSGSLGLVHPEKYIPHCTLRPREVVDSTDWMLEPKLIRPLWANCQTDLFATRLTHQLATYVSWRPDPKALHSNAFSLNWRGLRGYAFHQST